MIVEDREERVKWYTISLSSEKCSKISNNSRIEKCWNNRIEVLSSILFFGFVACFYEEKQCKSEYSTEEREIIILGNKKTMKKLSDLSRTEVDQNELFSYPFGSNVPESSEEKYRNSEWNNGGKYRFCESFSP